MGLDIRLVRVRRKHAEDNSAVEELYEKGTYVGDFRNAWDLLLILNLTESENEDAVCYRILNDLPLYRLDNCGNETQRFLDVYKDLDKEKFCYIIKADW